MLKINLLDRKSKVSSNALQDLLESTGLAGLEPEQRQSIAIFVVKMLVLYGIIWLSDAIPEHMKQQKISELQQRITVLEDEMKKLQAELRAKEAIRAEMDQIKQKEADLRGKLSIVSALDTDRYRAFKVMDTISLLIPDRVWIDTLNFTNKQLTLQGASWEFVPINDFVALLKESGIFDAVTLKGITSSAQGAPVPGVPLALQTLKRYEVNTEIKGNLTTASAN